MEERKFEVEVEKVNGDCCFGYKEGDKFQLDGIATPDNRFCGGAYVILFPMIVALSSGSRFDFEENPYSKTKLACPSNGDVLFKITALEEE